MDYHLVSHPSALLEHPLWQHRVEFLSQEAREQLSYRRARLVLNAYGKY